MKKALALLFLITFTVVALFLFISCEEEIPENLPPEITLTSNLTTTDPNVELTITVTVEDEEDDSHSITWAIDNTTLTDEASMELKYTFTEPGSYTISAIVIDGTNEVDEEITITINDFELTGIWQLTNTDLNTGTIATGSSTNVGGYEWILENSYYTLLYTGNSMGYSSYGQITKFLTDDKYFITLVTDDDLAPPTGPKYYKIGYEMTDDGGFYMSNYEDKDTASEAEASTTIIWGTTPENVKITTELPEITGTWLGTDQFGKIEYAVTATKFGFERFTDPNARVGGGDIVALDNNNNSMILYITRHELDSNQVGKYMKLAWTPADPLKTIGSNIDCTIYNQHDNQTDAENETTVFITAHTVTKQ